MLQTDEVQRSLGKDAGSAGSSPTRATEDAASRPLGPSERDVVFGCGSAARRRRGEVAFVGRDVAARRAEAAAVAATTGVAVATAGPVAGAEELDGVGDDLD